MANIYSAAEIEKIAKGGKILAEIFAALKNKIVVGVSLKELDELAFQLSREKGARPAFLGYRPGGARKAYPASICASLNDVVVHGQPTGYRLQSGDILKIDFGIYFENCYSDSAFTVVIGKSSREKDSLLSATKEALEQAIKHVKPGNRLGDIGWAVESVAKKNKCHVIKGLAGHGIGRELHEEPTIFNFGKKGGGAELKPGMVLAIEPMFSLGSERVIQLKDESWATADGSLSAHFEHTVAVTEKGVRILTE